MENVLITGATSGIGYEFAKIFASNNYNLILCARNKEKLKKIKENLTYQVLEKVMLQEILLKKLMVLALS